MCVCVWQPPVGQPWPGSLGQREGSQSQTRRSLFPPPSWRAAFPGGASEDVRRSRTNPAVGALMALCLHELPAASIQLNLTLLMSFFVAQTLETEAGKKTGTLKVAAGHTQSQNNWNLIIHDLLYIALVSLTMLWIKTQKTTIQTGKLLHSDLFPVFSLFKPKTNRICLSCIKTPKQFYGNLFIQTRNNYIQRQIIIIFIPFKGKSVASI